MSDRHRVLVLGLTMRGGRTGPLLATLSIREEREGSRGPAVVEMKATEHGPQVNATGRIPFCPEIRCGDSDMRTRT